MLCSTKSNHLFGERFFLSLKLKLCSGAFEKAALSIRLEGSIALLPIDVTRNKYCMTATFNGATFNAGLGSMSHVVSPESFCSTCVPWSCMLYTCPLRRDTGGHPHTQLNQL